MLGTMTLAAIERAPDPADTVWDGLVARMRQNDPTAFETAITLTREPAWRLACQMLGDPHLAQDVLQDAWVVVMTRLDNLQKPSAFKSWFLQIVLNTCRGAVKQRQRRPVAEPTSEPAAPGFEEPVARVDEVKRALVRLSPKERSAVLLRDYLQLTYEEMASVLAVPLGTVKSRLNQARRQLLHLLKGDAR